MNFNLMTPQPIETAPEGYNFFLAYFTPQRRWVIGYRSDNHIYDEGYPLKLDYFSHWLPLPDAPKPTSDFFSVAKDIIKTSL